MTPKELVARIANDFPFFCSTALTVAQRDWRASPQTSSISSKNLTLSSKQLDFIKHIQGPESEKVVLKCRQRGYTTISLAYCLWKVLYSKNENILYLIDNAKKARELYTVIDQMLASIPVFLKPKKLRTYMSSPARIENDALNSRVKFETATENSARSGTYTMIVLDEFAFYEESIKSVIRSSITIACPNNRVIISTPKREGDAYEAAVTIAQEQGTLFKHSYWDDAEEWFGSLDNARLWRTQAEYGMTKAYIAREYDCKFKGVVENRVYLIDTDIYIKEATVPAQAIVALDLGWSDNTAILFAYDYGNYLHICDEIVVNQVTTPQVVKMIQDKGYRLKVGICDSSGKKTDQTSGASVWAQLQRGLGIPFKTQKGTQEDLVAAVNSAFLKEFVLIDPKCRQLIEMLNNYEYDKNGNIPHDDYSHISDALRYLIWNWPSLTLKSGHYSARMVPAKRVRY